MEPFPASKNYEKLWDDRVGQGELLCLLATLQNGNKFELQIQEVSRI
jgi:hypothetical protein